MTDFGPEYYNTLKEFTVLIVDDVPANVNKIVDILKPYGSGLAKAYSGREAMEYIDRQKPSMILLDLMMPDITGWKVIRYVRERYSYDELPIIVTSAITNHENISECYKMGVNDYVAKPIVPDRLLNSVVVQTRKLYSEGRR